VLHTLVKRPRHRARLLVRRSRLPVLVPGRAARARALAPPRQAADPPTYRSRLPVLVTGTRSLGTRATAPGGLAAAPAHSPVCPALLQPRAPDPAPPEVQPQPAMAYSVPRMTYRGFVLPTVDCCLLMHLYFFEICDMQSAASLFSA
jgi:hypothetical protein